MRDDLEDLKLRKNNVNTEILASTRRMLGLVNESQDAGAKTLQLLHTQGDQFNNIERGLDNIQESLLESEKHLTQMEKVEKCYCCVFCQKRNKRKQGHQDTEQSRPLNRTSGHEYKNTTNKYNSSSSKSQSSIHTRHPNGNESNEEENNLGEIFAHIDTLKGQAIDLGQVVTSHNTQLSRMNIKAETNNNKLKDVSGRTTNLLESTSSTFLNCKYCKYFAGLFKFSNKI